MKIFNKKMKEETKKIKNSQNDNSESEINERPRICCLDLEEKTTDLLTKSGFNLYIGTLGNKIRVPNNNQRDNHLLLLNFDFPVNIHEYDIFILDLENSKIIDYKIEEHKRKEHTGKSALSLLSRYPETIFDPRPFSSKILKSKLSQIGERPHIIIVFTTSSYDIDYEKVKITEGHSSIIGNEEYNIYYFAGNTPLSGSKDGVEMQICDIREDLKSLLESNLKTAIYNQTFNHPTKWENNQWSPDNKYTPLVKNSNNDIVSFVERRDNSFVFYFPQIKTKGEFLKEFLSGIAPDMLPELFPYSTTFNWKQNEEYWLPNHKIHLEEKDSIKKEFEEKIKLKNNKISSNIKQYSFLHEIITETGDKLVDSLINYLKWLGFKNVKKVDEENSGMKLLEEDIQVELEDGLLIIECKGIGGTSTDSDCSQISKIKHRRCKERNSFDVFALYIVNHQRYLPPLNRKNPPFTENQIQDASNDERGLLSTWQLFNLYPEIEEGIIDKENVQKDLLLHGYIEFKPKDLIFIDEPKEIFKDGEVCIVNISNLELKIGDEILVERRGRYQVNMIEEIKLNEKHVDSASSGELGLKLNKPVKKKSILWKKAEN